jgi:hypothetical protein
MRIKLERHEARMGEKRKMLVGKHKGKRLLGRSRCRWESTIKLISKNRMRGCGFHSFGLEVGPMRAVVNTAENLWVIYLLVKDSTRWIY